MFNVTVHLHPFLNTTLLSGLHALEKEALNSLYVLWPLLREKESLAEKLILDEEQLEFLERTVSK